jgi:hypothetical protein
VQSLDQLSAPLAAAALQERPLKARVKVVRVNPHLDPELHAVERERLHIGVGAGGYYVLAARDCGYSFEALVNRIVDVAHARYFESPNPLAANAGVPGLAVAS